MNEKMQAAKAKLLKVATLLNQIEGVLIRELGPSDATTMVHSLGMDTMMTISKIEEVAK